jgi:anti-sigma factor RsiW
MAAAVDGALTVHERTALDAHVAGCPACAAEMRRTETLLTALDGLGRETEVPARLEQATLRRIRLAADEAPERRRWWSWLGTPVPALALAATVVVALSVTALRNTADVPGASAPAPAPQVAKAPPPVPAPVEPRVVASARPPVAPAVPTPPVEPPPALAASPDLFIDLPILRHMEKLSHFEAIETTTLDEGEGGTGTRNGESG